MAEAPKTDTLDPDADLAEAYLENFPTDAVSVLDGLEREELTELLESQPEERSARILEGVTEHLAAECLTRLDGQAWQRIAARVNPYRLALLLSKLEPSQRQHLLADLEADLARELGDIMSYPPDTAGALMDTRVLSFRPGATVKEALARLATWHRKDLRYVPVVDAEGRLLALLPLAELALATPRQRLEQLIKTVPPRVNATAPREDVLSAFAASKVASLPVVDGRDRLLGLIRQEGLMKAVREEATTDLATLVGASKDELALSPALFAVRKRLPWLNINLLTAFLAAAVVGLFESTIAQFTALAVLLPVVAGQSGNTGAQALAVVIRGLALREIRARDYPPVLLKEALAGALNGIAIAVVTVIGVFVWSRSVGLCLVIFLAMILSMAIASVAGAAIPLVLSALRQDPAQSGSIILTTVTDVMGFFSFLGLATLLSAML